MPTRYLFRPKEWHNGNHQKINTGHKAFDRQTSMIGAGNHIGGTILSTHVRPHGETKCGPVSFDPGHLRAYDLNHFRNLPNALREWFRRNPETHCILYQFFHHHGDHKITHGYAVTHADDHRLLFRWDTGHGKARNVVNECITYVVATGKEEYTPK